MTTKLIVAGGCLASFPARTMKQAEAARIKENKSITNRMQLSTKEESEEEQYSEEEFQVDEFTQARQEALREIDPDLYNPHPDEAERLKCQHAYLSLLTQLKSNRKNIISDLKDNSLNEILKESDELYKNVKRPVDSVLDSKLLVASADLGHLRLKNIPSLVESSFSSDEFSEELKSKFPAVHEEGGELVDFALLGERLNLTYLWKGVYVLKKQLISLHQPRHKQTQQDAENSQTSTRQRQKKVNNTPDVEQEVAQELEKPMGEKETFDFVRDVFLILKEIGGRYNYYKFILDPLSFARSVENMFYVAFLVKEDRVKISGSCEDDLEVVILEDEEEVGLQSEKRQTIMDLTMEKWARLCQKYQIQSPLMKS